MVWMIRLYVNLIKGGHWKPENVPERWRTEVERELAEEGGNNDGNGSI